MTDQTPDPWKDAFRCGHTMVLLDGQGRARTVEVALRADIEAARDAERQQHQQTIQQQAETIRQLNDTVSRCAIDLLEKDRQIETLTQERDAARAWHRVIDNELVTTSTLTAENEHDPVKALAAVIQWWMAFALDPAVSEGARQLVEQALAGASRPTEGEQGAPQ